MKAFDKDGKEIDVFSQDELNAKIKEAGEAAIAASKAEADASKAKADADAAAAAAAANNGGEEMPAWAKELMAKVESVSTRETLSYVDKVATGLDADRRKIVEAKFSSLTGYDETPEGMGRRAEDAYLLATGEKFNAGTVDMSNLSAAGGGRTNSDSKAVTESDKAVQSALGITAADVEKFGKK